ncbi:PREDICTED: plasma serine protease inhibitor [Hipposideros armiger]|uniref:Plasma serine protease inhibitor n=1 Tax=Hipposideros armiger TaxID=186990 RepID=A0A8B7RCU1_HIPAR|nr:PREDICTED: plasma serine protease inhibitor [Hipposideros armiger]
MQLCLLLCLVLLNPQVVSLRRHHSQATKKRVRELPVVTTVAPGHRDFTFDLFRALSLDYITEEYPFELTRLESQRLEDFRGFFAAANSPQPPVRIFGEFLIFRPCSPLAKWETNFNLKSTKTQDFHVTSEMVVQVPMMTREDQYYYLLDRNLFCKVVGVPYQGNATAFFILPNKGRMGQVEAGLNQVTLRNWLKMLTKRKLLLYLPKFSIEGSYQLDKVLPKLGIRDIFTSNADLTGFTNHSNIQVSEMVHKAVVEVDESGTKAAAATNTVFAFRSARVGSQLVVFNRPFLIVIVENTENILFLGKLMRP